MPFSSPAFSPWLAASCPAHACRQRRRTAHHPPHRDRGNRRHLSPHRPPARAPRNRRRPPSHRRRRTPPRQPENRRSPGRPSRHLAVVPARAEAIILGVMRIATISPSTAKPCTSASPTAKPPSNSTQTGSANPRSRGCAAPTPTRPVSPAAVGSIASSSSTAPTGSAAPPPPSPVRTFRLELEIASTRHSAAILPVSRVVDR